MLILKDLSSLCSHVYTDANKRQDKIMEMVELKRNCKSAETASAHVVSEDLSDALIAELEHPYKE